MKKFAVLVVMAFLTLMVSSVTYAREPQAPNGVNTFTISPDPAAAGSSVTIAINVNITADSDNTTAFCLYAPDTAVGTFPSPITLSYSSGFTTTPVDFTAATGTCPTRTGQTSRVYTSPASLPIGDVTYEGNASFAINGSAVAGTYDWTLLLQEPGGGVNPLSYLHEITVAETPYLGLSGRIIDSKTLNAWAYGGEIKVQQTTGTNVGLKGTSYVANDGTWSVVFDTPADPLDLCSGSCSEGNNNATYVVTVNFKCNLEVAVGTRVNIADGTQVAGAGNYCPISGMTAIPVQFEVTVTDSATSAMFDVGDWETKRGPTAVTLQSVTTDNNSTAIGIGFVVLMLAGVSFVMLRRREVA